MALEGITCLTALLAIWVGLKWPALAPKRFVDLTLRVVMVEVFTLVMAQVPAGNYKMAWVGIAGLFYICLVGVWIIQWATNMLKGKGPDTGHQVKA